MQPFNEAYAAAMREVAKQFPDDLDVQVLFAEALMDVNPWKLWTPDGKPAPGTEEIVATLERVLAQGRRSTRARTTTTSTRSRPRRSPSGRCRRPIGSPG